MNYEFAKELRQLQTPPESLLWSCLRKNRISGLSFRRQHPIGPYIVDFYCFKKKLIIELDGAFHSLPLQAVQDKVRQNYLESKGLRILRLEAKEVLSNIDGVIVTIQQALEDVVSPKNPTHSTKR